MADDALVLRISAKTDEFVKKVQDAQIKARSLSQQMSEIDKQLKTESVDRVQKLSEKLNLAKRASEMAAKEAELYAEKIKKMAEKHEDASQMTDKQKETLLKLSEQMATAQQKAQTYAAEVDKLSRELDETASTTDKAEKEIEDIAEATGAAAMSAKEGAKGLGTFGQSVMANLLSTAITKGIEKTIGLFKNLAAAAWDAAKRIAGAMKDYAVKAVDMAADYADAVGYSEQVFEEQAENVQQWVNDNSVALRLNKSELQGYVNNMGSLYRSFGIGSEKAAELSESLITLATDLRSATGDDTGQIIQSLMSVMTGGYQAGYKYGIVINEAAIKAKAIAMNLVDIAVDEQKVEKARIKLEKATKSASEATVKYGEGSLQAREAQLAVEEATAAFEEALGGQNLALTQAQKEMAIYALAMEQTEHLQGQGARESKNYKSQLDELRTTFENLQIDIGGKLLPVLENTLQKFNAFLETKEGKELLDGIVESVGNLSDKVMEFIESGKVDEWFNAAKEKLPEITENIIQFSEKVTELIPRVFELTEKILSLFGIKTENEKIKEAFLEVEGQIKQFATNSGTDIDTMIEVIHAYAAAHEVDLVTIYNNWGEYQPKISDYIKQITTDASGAETDLDTALQGMTTSTQTNVESQITLWDRLIRKINEVGEFLNSPAGKILKFIYNPTQALPELLAGELFSRRAGGGPVLPGQIYQINDDHGRRKELFRPAVPGYILDGNKTQELVSKATTASQIYTDKAESLRTRIREELEQMLSKTDLLNIPRRASGGPVLPGQIYQVNDDHGQREGLFRLKLPDNILNSAPAQNIVNNNNSSTSNSYGNINVYVNSYGADAASIADEIGQAVNQRLRMAGAW